MFEKCTNITSVRILKKVLPDSADGCFGRLFAGCSNLSEIVYYCDKLGEDSNTGINHTFNWVENVSSTGTWYNANYQNFTNMSYSEIPNGWLIKEEDVGEPVDPNTINDYFTLTNLDDTDKTIYIKSRSNNSKIYYTNNDLIWNKIISQDFAVISIILKANQKIRLK
ncbi:MAG: hypothetical protein PUJ51_10295 [Clostridiales bacterium]|nr:hypothetical protein [Clostridiales bacterium]